MELNLFHLLLTATHLSQETLHLSVNLANAIYLLIYFIQNFTNMLKPILVGHTYNNQYI